MPDHSFIRFGSHRARTYAFRVLAVRPQGYWSMTRRTHPGGVYLVPTDTLPALRDARVRFTVIRGPYDDLRECWPMDQPLFLGRV